jgi:hypothetical protein
MLVDQCLAPELFAILADFPVQIFEQVSRLVVYGLDSRMFQEAYELKCAAWQTGGTCAGCTQCCGAVCHADKVVVGRESCM